MINHTIPIFIGCAPNHDDAESQAVLEYTIRKHASRPVNITWMMLSNDRRSPFFGWDTSSWATPFSGFRYAVPALAGFRGRAIYMDSDVIVRGDVAELMALPMTGDVMAKAPNRLCVSLWDCMSPRHVGLREAMRGDRPGGLRVDPFPRDENWNCLDGEKYESLDDPEIKAIHYTSMPHQPHLPRAMRRLGVAGRKHWFDGKPTTHWRPDLIELFDAMFHEAAEAGYTVDRYCQHEPFGTVNKGTNAGLRGVVPSWGLR